LTALAVFVLPFFAAGASVPQFTAALASDEGPLDVAPYKYISNGHDKSRSPCPFLNTAANHGILPHDGKNIHVDVFARLLKKAGLPKQLADVLLGKIRGIAKDHASKDSSHPDDAIDLAELNPHGLIEHDLSISRWDVVTPKAGDNFATPDLMGKFLSYTNKFAKDNGNDPASVTQNKITVTSLGAWHNERRRLELQRHIPDESFKSKFLCAGECVFLLYFLGQNGAISGKDANTFLYHERFPDGWTPPTDMNMIKTLAKTTECATSFEMKNEWLSWLNHPSRLLDAFKGLAPAL